MRTIKFDGPGSSVVPASPSDLKRGIGPKIIDSANLQPITTTVDIGTRFKAEISDQHFTGFHSIMLEIGREKRSAAASQKSKIEINIVRQAEPVMDREFHGKFGLSKDTVHVLKFSFKMDQEKYERPLSWIIHMQVFQCCVRNGHPPLVLSALRGYDSPDGSIEMAFIRQSDAIILAQGQQNTGKRLTLLNGSDSFALSRGEWHRFEVYLRPGPTKAVADQTKSNGEIRVALDDLPLLEFHGSWCYSTQIGGETAYGVKLGIYRPAQNTRQRVYFDDISWYRSQ